jgi:hypothetical protein
VMQYRYRPFSWSDVLIDGGSVHVRRQYL